MCGSWHHRAGRVQESSGDSGQNFPGSKLAIAVGGFFFSWFHGPLPRFQNQEDMEQSFSSEERFNSLDFSCSRRRSVHLWGPQGRRFRRIGEPDRP